jgi:hypothetical protein
MTTIRWARLVALGLWLSAGCSQGADPEQQGTWPPGGPAPDDGDTGPATFGADPDGGSCCLPQEEPGCADDEIEACVCMQSPSCCTSLWTEGCATLVDELGCGFCVGAPPPDTTTVGDPDGSGEPPPPPGGQDCCMAGSGSGCADPEIEACVCNEIPFCCDSGWEEVCASAVEALSCGHCGGAGGTGDPPPPGDTGEPPPGDTGEPPPTGGCCEILMTPGCDDATVQDCVCMQDAYCCDTAWDDVCVGEVDSFGCGDCGGGMMPPPEASTCCSAQMTPGCDDQAIADCVCFIDDYCCNTAWDATCAIFVELFLCGSCS